MKNFGSFKQAIHTHVHGSRGHKIQANLNEFQAAIRTFYNKIDHAFPLVIK